nr:putative disease resistance RPP13-like protein 3 [Ipomoea trifida]
MAPVVEENIVVGFDGEVKIIKDRLLRESMDLTVISIVGMPGVGKTTFAKMVFNDRELQYEFFTRCWVSVSQDCSRSQILFDILSKLTGTSLNVDECWELLEKKIFGGERCPTSLEDFGKSIAMKCNGVPIVVEKISKVLRENMTLADWRRIESNPLASIGYDDPTMK